MKLYYYTYETTVFRSFFDTEYDMEDGFLIDSPVGLIQVYEEYESNTWSSVEEFRNHVSRFQPRNFNIVELK